MGNETPRRDEIEVDHKQIGRLAMRHEGTFWNAYYAMQGTMEGAIHLGSLHMRFAIQDKHKTVFMTLMREAVADLIEEQFGRRPVWGGEVGAPEHERAGHS